MTPDKFKSIIASVIQSKELHLSSFGESALNALARDYNKGAIETDTVIERLGTIYTGDNAINRKDLATIKERLERNQ